MVSAIKDDVKDGIKNQTLASILQMVARIFDTIMVPLLNIID